MKAEKWLDLPYPRGIPLIGNVLQIDASRSHWQQVEWREQLGPVFCLRMFFENMLVVNDYESIREVLVTKGHDYSNRPSNFLRLQLYSYNGKDIGFANSDEPFWYPMRKIIHSHIKVHAGGIDRIQEVVGMSMDDFFNSIRESNGLPLDARELFYHFTIKTIAILTLGRVLADDEYVRKAIISIESKTSTSLTLTGDGAVLDTFPWLRYFGHVTYKEIMQVRKELLEVWNYVKPKIVEAMDPENPESVVEALLVKQDTIKDENGKLLVEDIHIMCAFNDLVIAGVSTTSRSLYLYINVFLNHPEELQKIYDEIVAVVGTGRTVTLYDRDNMPYTRAVIYELVRFVTVTPGSLPHTTLKNTSVCGVNVPKGTNVSVNFLALHYDKNFWGDPEVFKPSRFLTEDGQVVSPDHPNRKHVMQFSAGPRMCMGGQLAMARIFLLLTNLIRQFKITRTELEAVSCSPKYHTPTINVASQPYLARFIPRENIT